MLADPCLSVYRRTWGVDSGAFLARFLLVSHFTAYIVPYPVSKRKGIAQVRMRKYSPNASISETETLLAGLLARKGNNWERRV
jgi:hypothetical protein